MNGVRSRKVKSQNSSDCSSKGWCYHLFPERYQSDGMKKPRATEDSLGEHRAVGPIHAAGPWGPWMGTHAQPISIFYANFNEGYLEGRGSGARGHIRSASGVKAVCLTPASDGSLSLSPSCICLSCSCFHRSMLSMKRMLESLTGISHYWAPCATHGSRYEKCEWSWSKEEISNVSPMVQLKPSDLFVSSSNFAIFYRAIFSYSPHPTEQWLWPPLAIRTALCSGAKSSRSPPQSLFLCETEEQWTTKTSQQ